MSTALLQHSYSTSVLEQGQHPFKLILSRHYYGYNFHSQHPFDLQVAP
jgi:hypothetical protein